MAASADRLAEFLAGARAQGRPAVAISVAMAAELLGFTPDAAYWSQREFTGWVVDAGRVITFTPSSRAGSGVGEGDPRQVDPTDVRVVLAWLAVDEATAGPGLYRRDGATGARFGEVEDVTTLRGDDVRVASVVELTSGGRTARLSLAAPQLRRLALLAAELPPGPPG